MAIASVTAHVSWIWPGDPEAERPYISFYYVSYLLIDISFLFYPSFYMLPTTVAECFHLNAFWGDRK